MSPEGLSRRAFLGAAAAAFAGAVVGCSGAERGQRRGTASLSPITPTPSPITRSPLDEGPGRAPLWETAIRRGLVYGSSAATWQISDREYRRLFAREAAMLFTEDDLLWYRLKPAPDAELDFRFGDRIVGFAEY